MWDIVGKTPHPLDRGSDEPGRISVIPGGVAMNIAMALRRFDLPVTLLACLGRDRNGDTLIVEAAQRGIRTDYVYRAPDLSTDRYIAIEDESGMIAAVADAHSLEQGADRLLAPLHDGRLGSAEAPWSGMIILDGNFRTEQLTELAQSPVLRHADIRLAPASPGKSRRLRPFLSHPNTTLYVNRGEAEYILDAKFRTSAEAASALAETGVKQAVVTDSGNPASASRDGRTISMSPPRVTIRRYTGAGDVFLSAHICAELHGHHGNSALRRALDEAATYISSETSL
jgi:sugar/nucleoside kinase (ribokinase family)